MGFQDWCDPNRHLTSPSVQGSNPVAVDFDCDGSLEKTHGDHETLLLANFNQKPFETRQGPLCNTHLLSYFQKRIRLSREAGSDSGSDRIDFGLIDGYRDLSDADETHNARNRQ